METKAVGHRASISDYLSLIKFTHTVFALPFALIGYFIAVWHEGFSFQWGLLLLVILCMVLARTSAMAFNRWADRKIDAFNQRTMNREVPRGKISATASLGLAIISAALFIASTFFINQICFYLSPVAIAVVLGYSFTKRFTSLSHLILGLGLSLAPIGAYLAVAGEFDLLPVLIGGAVLFWVSGFDIIYALQDTEFDRSHGLKSLPASIGNRNALILSSLLHTFTIGLLFAAGWAGEMGVLYWIGYGLFLAMLTYQHTVVKPNDLSRINMAFFTANGVAGVIFATFAIADLWRTFHGESIGN